MSHLISQPFKIFVPGRLCLFGEHSDWAAKYRDNDPKIEKGYALVVGTNQGLYAHVKHHCQNLIFQATLNDGSKSELISYPMQKEVLLESAQRGGFASYIAGTAYQILQHCQVGGIEINNYLSDLPIQKGLSSSAAVCVLVARAFNRLYNLHLSVEEEIEIAYWGERTTPSLCGRMDPIACAFGQTSILMSFDGEAVELKQLSVQRELFLVIVDLGGTKETQTILRDLNRCYPQARDPIQENVQKYLGIINGELVRQAVKALEAGDAPQLGNLMNQAQEQFDRHLQPACPEQLSAPKLHQLLNHPALLAWIYGGKGVGSQGDGTAQLVVKDRAAQEQARALIQRDFPEMQTYPLTISPHSSVKKAVIPAAGLGTRMFPITKAIKKEFLPILDRDGRVKPIILKIVEEAVAGGISEIAIIVQAGDLALFQDFFSAEAKPKLAAKLGPEYLEYDRYLQDLGRRITFVVQENQEGFGHAVFAAKTWVGSEPFLLLLGDHLYQSQETRCCAAQLLAAFDLGNSSVVGLTVMSQEIIHKAGCVTGIWEEPELLLRITQLYEKPDLKYARANLQVTGMAGSDFLGIFGMYVLTPEIFDCLEAEISQNLRYRGEFQLTTSLERLRAQQGMRGYLVKGQYFDVGMPQCYWQTLQDFYLYSTEGREDKAQK